MKRIRPGEICVLCHKAIGTDRWGRINGRALVNYQLHMRTVMHFSCLELAEKTGPRV
jgi:hypothetical protein